MSKLKASVPAQAPGVLRNGSSAGTTPKPPPCPSCRKTNCGNWAACARRESSRCKRCRKSPCYDETHCTRSDIMWNAIARVEAMLKPHLPELTAQWREKDPDPNAELPPDVIGKLRRTCFDTMLKQIEEIERQEKHRMLASLMFGQPYRPTPKIR